MKEKNYIISKKNIVLLFIFSIICFFFDGSIFMLHRIADIYSVLLLEFSYFIPVILAITINEIVEKKNIIKERSVKIIKILFYIFSFIYFLLALYMALIMRAWSLLLRDVS